MKGPGLVMWLIECHANSTVWGEAHTINLWLVLSRLTYDLLSYNWNTVEYSIRQTNELSVGAEHS